MLHSVHGSITATPEAKVNSVVDETVNFMVAEGDKVAVHSHCDATQRGPLGALPARELRERGAVTFIYNLRGATPFLVRAMMEGENIVFEVQ